MTEPSHSKTNSAEAALSTTYSRPADIWRQFIAGGIIVCKSPGAAMNLRQRMYRARKLMQEAYGYTPYDSMVIKLAHRDNRLVITERDEGIEEMFPNPDSPQEIDESDPEIIKATRPPAQAPKEPVEDERGRAPLGFEPEDVK